MASPGVEDPVGWICNPNPSELASGVKGEPGLFELGGEAGPHRVDLALRLLGKGDVAHVVHAAGDDDLQNAFLIADVAGRAAYARRKRDGVELLEDRPLGSVVIPTQFEAASEHGEGFVGLPVRVQPRALAR